jgi:threonine synthase
MYYISTRGSHEAVLSTEAIKMGIAPDGGLFVPERIPKIKLDAIKDLSEMTYCDRAIEILGKFLDDYSEEELEECVTKAYSRTRFDHDDIAPVVALNHYVQMLELWHGPTCAFKDMALQILPHFLVKAMEKTGETDEIVILVATSGDTGKAALEGFKDVEGTSIIVFYPESGVSEVQRMQMITQTGNNVHSIAVRGNFDDAQSGVKEIFADGIIKEKMSIASYKFSSANSINWGRLAPQIIYYFSAYADMLKNKDIQLGEKINFVVPTGNFGNILAAYYAKEMGLPVNKLICASNDNNVLTDFINTGTYDKNRKFKKTISPSMDILISSNLERLLFELSGRDDELVLSWMDKLKTEGIYSVSPEIKNKVSEIFWAAWSDEEETLDTIKSIYNQYNYVIDTHTAVAVDVYDKYVISTGDLTKTVIASTASPFKFNESVVKAIFGDEAVEGKDEFEMLEVLSQKSGLKIPEGLAGLNEKAILHNRVCDKTDMANQVMEILGI